MSGTQNRPSVSEETIIAVLEALSPEFSQRMREKLGSGQLTPSPVFITESEREWYPEELINLAGVACPPWSEASFNRGFSPKAWRRSVRESIRYLREAHAETAYAFLLRKGIQNLANDWYQTVEREWQRYATAAPSNGYAEWYAPLYGSVIATQVGAGERFPEGRIAGENSVVVNHKFGLIEAFDREFFDDDQTGQIRQRAQRLGQSMAQTENAYMAIRFLGVAGSYMNLNVPASTYTTTDVNGNTVTGPFSATLYGTYGNRLPAYAALSLGGLKQLWAYALVAKDPLGNKIITQPNILLHSAMDSLHAPLLVRPPAGVPYYPAPIGATGTTASSAASGYPGGVFGANPFQGLGIDPVMARYLADWAWALGEKKGFIVQERDPLEVVQEASNSGQGFESDAIRYRSRRRFEAEWVGGGGRFWNLGNSGEATGSF
jgi:hypothetical protein